MNILIIGKFSPDQFAYHISDTLKNSGHTTFEFDPTLNYKYSSTTIGRRIYQVSNILIHNLSSTKYYREKRKKRIDKIINKSKIDLIISTHDFLYPDEVEQLKKKTNSPVVLWFPDSIAGFQKGLFFISDYDYLFFKDPYIVEILSSEYNLKNVFFLPECCNPKFHKPIKLNSEDLKHYSADITTYGNPHSIRSSFFNQLAEINFKIKIWGHKPPIWFENNKIKSLYTSEYVYNDSKCKSVLASKIILNTLHPTEVRSLNARAFEIAGIGGFQIINYRTELDNYFKDGQEIISFRNFNELLQKINYFLKEEDERKNIAFAGYERAIRDHTYQIRLKRLISISNPNQQ